MAAYQVLPLPLVLDLAHFFQVANVIFFSHVDDADTVEIIEIFNGTGITVQLVDSTGKAVCQKEFTNSLLIDTSGYHAEVEDYELCFKRRFYWLIASAMFMPPIALRLDSNFITMRQDDAPGHLLLTEHYRVKKQLFEVTLGSWSPAQRLDIPIAHTWERRKNMKGITMKIATLPFPQVIVPTKDQDFDGLLVSYIKIYSDLSNFTLEWDMPADRSWGIPTGNESWNGIIGMIQRKEADIGVAPLTVSVERDEVVDFLPDPSFRSKEALIIINPAYI